MNKEFLSKDLTDMFDDEDTVETTWWELDMFEDEEPTAKEEVKDTEPEDKSSEEPKTETQDELDLSDLDKLIEEVDTITEWAEEAKEEMKTTVQDVQEALANEDTAQVQKLVDDLYEQILKYEADIETNKTKYDVLKSKFDDISKQLEEANFKVEEVSVTKISTDPQMKVLNRMFDDAVTWSETAKKKVTSLLEDMYYKITGETLEDKQIKDTIEDWVDNGKWSNSTSFEYEEPEEDESLQEWILWIY